MIVAVAHHQLGIAPNGLTESPPGCLPQQRHEDERLRSAGGDQPLMMVVAILPPCHQILDHGAHRPRPTGQKPFEPFGDIPRPKPGCHRFPEFAPAPGRRSRRRPRLFKRGRSQTLHLENAELLPISHAISHDRKNEDHRDQHPTQHVVHLPVVCQELSTYPPATTRRPRETASIHASPPSSTSAAAMPLGLLTARPPHSHSQSPAHTGSNTTHPPNTATRPPTTRTDNPPNTKKKGGPPQRDNPPTNKEPPQQKGTTPNP
jgi:hypothetical protein